MDKDYKLNLATTGAGQGVSKDLGGSLDHSNGHTLIYGIASPGKTAMPKNILEQFKKKNDDGK